MRKIHFAVPFLLVMVLLLSLPVVAADGESRSIFSGLLDIGIFIRDLFVPDGNYFNNQLSSLNDHINSRFAGLGQLYQMINHFFQQLQNAPTAKLGLTIPSNFFFPGYRGTKVDFLLSARPYIELLRDVLNASACLLTAIICYHKLRHFFTEGE